MRYILGMHVCPQCPNCDLGPSPCMDHVGSSSSPGGGALGRVEAIFGSIECQKAGALHAHIQ
eukprot:1492167-Prorocentrum_lima.AAC.1